MNQNLNIKKQRSLKFILLLMSGLFSITDYSAQIIQQRQSKLSNDSLAHNIIIQSNNVLTSQENYIINKSQSSDGSINPKDYGFEEIYIDGELFYIKRENNITIMYEPK